MNGGRPSLLCSLNGSIYGERIPLCSLRTYEVPRAYVILPPGFRPLPEPMRAGNPALVEFEQPPEIWGYGDHGELAGLLSRFIDECETSGMKRAEFAVLTRGKELLSEVMPGTVQRSGAVPWRDNDSFSQNVAKSKYLLDRGRSRDAMLLLEREVSKRLAGAPTFHPNDLRKNILHYGVFQWRASLYEFLASLPRTNCILAEWIERANILICNNGFIPRPQLAIKGNSRQNRYSHLTFDELFATPDLYQDNAICSVGTVHSVKGKTFDGVLLVLKAKAGSSMNYTGLLHCQIQDHEELRILYVALTRPRKLLVLAVPNSQVAEWKRRFTDDAARCLADGNARLS